MDELIVGFIVGFIVVLCLGVVLAMVEQSRERKKRDPNSKMTAKERWIIILAVISLVIVLIAGVGVSGAY